MIERQHLRNITIALPENYVENLEKLQREGKIPTRSEGIRMALYDFLPKEAKRCQLLNYKPKAKKA